MIAVRRDVTKRGTRYRSVAIAGVAAALGLAALVPAPVAMAGWRLYGHDLANSRNARSAGPSMSQARSLSRAWTFKSPTGDFTGTPVVSRGVLVAGDNTGTVYALNANTGRKLWSKDLGQPINGSAAIAPNAARGGAVYVPVAKLGGPRLVALSLKNGKKRWDTTLTRQKTASVFGSPTYWHGKVYIGTSGPNSDDSTARGSVVAVDKHTGKVRWRTFMVPPHRDGAAVWSTPAIDKATGRLYVGTGNNYHAPATRTEDSIMALDTRTGRILGHFQATKGDIFSPDNPAGPDLDFGSSPNLFTAPGGARLVGEGQKSGDYWALNRRTMRPVWHTKVGPGSPVGGLLGSTAFDGARIYGANTLSGQVFALNRSGGMPWQSVDTGGVHWSPTTIANGVLYTMGPDGLLTARNPATGAILTKASVGAPSFGGISAAGDDMCVAVGTGPPPGGQDGSGSIVAFTAAR